MTNEARGSPIWHFRVILWRSRIFSPFKGCVEIGQPRVKLRTGKHDNIDHRHTRQFPLTSNDLLGDLWPCDGSFWATSAINHNKFVFKMDGWTLHSILRVSCRDFRDTDWKKKEDSGCWVTIDSLSSSNWHFGLKIHLQGNDGTSSIFKAVVLKLF